MKSKVTLYYKSLLNQDKNFVLDDLDGNRTIESYLSTLQNVFIDEFQYIKNQLTLSIKINMNQTNLEMIDSKDLNYVKIQNYDESSAILERPYYYFVINKTWRSKETIELVLVMDTINTFKFNSDYVVNSKSLVKRMHKNRFKKGLIINANIIAMFSSIASLSIDELFYLEDADGYMISCRTLDSTYINHNVPTRFRFKPVNESDSNKLYEGFIPTTLITINSVRISISNPVIRIVDVNLIRIIDLKSEDISSPVYKTSEAVIKENNSIDWALYYKNSSNQEEAPIDCYLVPSEAISLYYQQSAGELNSSNVPNGKYLIFSSTYPSGSLTFSYGTTTLTIREYSDYAESGYVLFAVYNDNGSIKAYAGTIRDNQFVGQEARWTLVHTGNVNIMNAPQYVRAYQKDSLPTASSWYGGEYLPTYAQTTINMGALVESTLYGNNSIDKTLDTNVKIINIPYSPTPFSVDANGIYTFDECWTYNVTDGKLKLTDFNKRFSNTIETNIEDILNIFSLEARISTDTSRILLDSKLYHSDYYRPKFVYDSFSRVFPLEQIDYEASIQNISNGKFKFTFVMSRNIVSKFLFKFDYVYKHANEDYPNIVAVARNNEEVLYNSSYLNYIRTGYNYDLKAKERQESASAVGLGLNIAGLLASIGVSFLPGGQAIGIGATIASGLGLVGQMVNYAKTTAQNEENIQRKLQESQRQAVSVLNADDYDLLYEYTQNKAKLCLYEASDNMRRVLDDLFYYGGYIVNEQMIPDINSRYWFNFVQATLIINDSSNLSKEIEDDIKEKFEQGVTFLHYHGRYDFEQNMENWETSVL